MKKKYQNRLEILHRLKQPGSPSIAVISEESGVPKATLYAWLSIDRRNGKQGIAQGSLLMTKRTKPRSPSVKLTFLGESHGLQGVTLQAFCDKNGVTVGELLSWRDLALSGIELADRDGIGATRKEHDAEMASLKEDLRRKNDALAETAALLILQKKTSEILGVRKW